MFIFYIIKKLKGEQQMTNFQIYKKTLSFSFIKFAVDLVALIAVVGASIAGFLIAGKAFNNSIVGLPIGLVVGIIIATLIEFFISNRIKAAHIAMITKGITEDELPEHTTKAGFDEIKGRFGKITVFFLITKAIKGIFNQIGRGINKLGTAVGGDVGNGVTSAINSAIQVVIGYLCDCCLGWVLYRKDINSFKAGCEGAVIFFKHGKTLVKNVGRIFGMGLLSLIIFGGAFFGLSFLILNALPGFISTLSNEIIQLGINNDIDIPSFVSNITLLTVVISAILAVVLWSMLHSVIARPFILVGVMRNFMAAGKAHIPSESEFQEVAAKSPKFARLLEKAK